ncbi:MULTISPECIES: hypothetical protein [Streptomyces]|nr:MULTISPECIES: hypothetical protein [Streptomyces]MYT03504.1 hypothetical protein [Streptomyces sp. SID5470]
MALTAAEIADIRRYAQELADQAPPLTPEQRRRSAGGGTGSRVELLTDVD